MTPEKTAPIPMPIRTLGVFQWDTSNDSSRFFSSRYCSRTPVLRLLYISSSSQVKVPASIALRPCGVIGCLYADFDTVFSPCASIFDNPTTRDAAAPCSSVAMALHDGCDAYAVAESSCRLRSSSARATAMPSSTSTRRSMMAPATMSREMAKIPTRESNQTVMTE